MRYPAGYKRKTSERIVHAAGRLFRKHGYSATGVDAVMAAADLTAGGFYSHFRSKEDLLAATLDTVFQCSAEDRPQHLNKLSGSAWLQAFVEFYLSKEHRDAEDRGCPMPALAAEVARIGGKPRAVFEENLSRVIDSVAFQFDGNQPDRQRAISCIALCLGAVTLSRAVGTPQLSEEILAAAREAAMNVIASDSTRGVARSATPVSRSKGAVVK
jgi:TetR/AcrR family transcriptional repressor of nem operon